MTTPTKLTLAEELLLIALDDESGRPIDLPPFWLDTALAAAILMELCLVGRLDTDPGRLIVVSGEPTGSPILDDVLAQIVADPAPHPSGVWIRRVGTRGHELREQVTNGLVARGVLKSVEKRLLWVFKTRAYPPTSGLEEQEVRSRIMTLLNNTEIPDPRDALLVGLLSATNIIGHLLSKSEAQRLAPRIEQIARLEEISRALDASVREIYLSLLAAQYPMA
jgi:Golgi phosphoprotein 3